MQSSIADLVNAACALVAQIKLLEYNLPNTFVTKLTLLDMKRIVERVKDPSALTQWL